MKTFIISHYATCFSRVENFSCIKMGNIQKEMEINKAWHYILVGALLQKQEKSNLLNFLLLKNQTFKFSLK